MRGKKWTFLWLPCGTGASIHKQEAEFPIQLRAGGRRPRFKKNKKRVLEVGFFVELKNRHIIQRLPVAPKLLAWPPRSIPSPHKTKGTRRKAEDRKFQGWGVLGLLETARERARQTQDRWRCYSPGGVGQGRSRRVSQLKGPGIVGQRATEGHPGGRR